MKGQPRTHGVKARARRNAIQQFQNLDQSCQVPQGEKLRDLLEMAGELLPLQYKGDPYTLLNFTECMDCLDHKNTEWVLGKTTGAKINVKRYVFMPNRLPESSIFKIPERPSSIFVAAGRFDPDDEFKHVVEKEKLEGLLFEEVSSDGS
jgi:hypothetical protein